MIENQTTNDKLWQKDLVLRDSGVVSIGSFIAVLNPEEIKTCFGNDIPLLQTKMSCLVLKNLNVSTR